MLFGFKFQDGGPWDENGVKAVIRFVERVEAVINTSSPMATPLLGRGELLRVQANTIKAVREDLEDFSFNTAVARCMEFLNAIQKQPDVDAIKTLVKLLAPMIPHIAEEFWEMLGESPSIFNQPFPVADDKYLERTSVEIAVQINSKIVGRVTIPVDATQGDTQKLCAEFIKGKNVVKVVFVKNRLVNFIVS